MARFAYHSLDGVTLSWARRLHDEGNEVLFFVKEDRKNAIGRGIVPMASSYAQWQSWGLADPSTIFFFDQTASGEHADSLRNMGRLVIGGGSFMDRLELDRKWGSDIAAKCGIAIPPTKAFSSITEAISFLQTNPKQEFGDGGWAWKPDRDIGCDATLVGKDAQTIIDHVLQIRRRFGDNQKCIIQEKIDGVAVSTARWWNGMSWVGPFEGTVENKKFMDKNLGPATGCSLNLVWFYREEEPIIGEQLHFEALANVFRKNNAPPGLYDINCILDSRAAWFLEWTPRLGIDSELTSQRGISNLGNFLASLVRGHSVEEFFDIDQAYFDVRLSVPPYPNSIDAKDYKSPALEVRLQGIDGLWDGMYVCAKIAWDEELGIHCIDPSGMIGSCVMAGTSLKKTYEKMYTWIKEKLKVPDLQYRTDAAEIIQEDLDKLTKFGWSTTDILRK